MSDLKEIPRPLFLGKLLDYRKTLKLSTNNQYHEFIRLCKLAQDHCSQSKINITGSFKLTHLVERQDKESNDTLMVLFSFYALILRRNRPVDLNNMQNQTMNFSEIEVLCRDTGIIPKLLQREELKIIWGMISQERLERGQKPLSMLLFQDFKDFVVRMAIFAYNKPGLKKLILAVEGFRPKSHHIVKAFCNFIHLNDMEKMKHFIRTVGRRTQGDINFRSKDEGNSPRHKKNLKIDSDARRLSQIQVKKHFSDDYFTSTFYRNVTTLTPATPAGVVKPHRDPPQYQFRSLKFPESYLPTEMTSKLRPGYIRKHSGDLQSLSLDNLGGNSTDSNDDGRVPIIHNVDDTSDDFMMNNDMPSTPQLMDFNSIDVVRKAFYEDYHPDLVKLLNQFSYKPPKHIETDLIETGAPLFDLGLLKEQSKVTLFLKITNGTPDEVDLDVTARNFGADDTDITTFSKPLITGFSRELEVQFTVPKGDRIVIAFVDVIVIAVRKGLSTVISCPIFYRVANHIESDKMPRCTSKTLPHLMSEYTNKQLFQQDKTVTINFQTKPIDGYWRTTHAFGNTATHQKDRISLPLTLPVSHSILELNNRNNRSSQSSKKSNQIL